MLELQYRKVARRRADTGARAAAIISAIGMPTGFRNLFQQNEPDTATRTFLFSRVIVNSKNEMVLQRALDSMFTGGGTVDALYGGQTEQIEAPTREVTAAQQAPLDEEPEDPWDEESPAENQTKEDPRVQLVTELEAWTNSDVISDRAKNLINDAINNPQNYSTEKLQEYVEKCRAKAHNGGAA
jgi:hypothetical protein